jgi:hypothetical protein
MNFTELKASITSLIDRSDYDIKAGVFINSAIRGLEQRRNWLGMERLLSGTLTSSVNSIDIPEKYKSVKYFIVPDSGIKILDKRSYDFIKANFPTPGIPSCFATLKAINKFIIGPTPRQDYTYELIYNRYSNDLTDASPTNFWMEDMWEIVYYGALMRYELDSGSKLNLGTEEAPMSPTLLYEQAYTMLSMAENNEEFSDKPVYETIAGVI